MAIIPLKQQITVTPIDTIDEWGQPTGGTPYTLKCRVSEGAKLVRDDNGNEVVSMAQIYIDKLASVSLTDTITYTDENAVTREYRPISIEVKRSLGGKPLLTVVSV